MMSIGNTFMMCIGNTFMVCIGNTLMVRISESPVSLHLIGNSVVSQKNKEFRNQQPVFSHWLFYLGGVGLKFSALNHSLTYFQT